MVQPLKKMKHTTSARRTSAGIGHSFEGLSQLSTGDTIVAISSPPGQSRRGLVRICGPLAHNCFAAITNQKTSIKPRVLSFCNITDLKIPCQVTYFVSPNSYTGDKTIELQIPGHPALLERVIQQIISNGARLAEPGEFTFRAFTSGKLDLTQAEGIAATISATCDSQLKAAELLKQGKLGHFSHSLVENLGTQLALVEAGIDFIDQDDVVPIEPKELDTRLETIAADLEDLLTHSRSWGSIEALPRVVLVGNPSVGKSTLFNALLGKKRAVISALPGTTRDVLAEPLTLTSKQGLPYEIMLVDIAGLEDNTDGIKRDAQQYAIKAITKADLILHIIDAETPALSCEHIPKGVPCLKILNKIDLCNELKQSNYDLKISAINGDGVADLRKLITQHVGDRGVSIASDMLALQPRHEQALKSTLSHINHSRSMLSHQLTEHGIDEIELLAGELRIALDKLAGLGGEMSPDEVIGKVFANFCVGK